MCSAERSARACKVNVGLVPPDCGNSPAPADINGRSGRIASHQRAAADMPSRERPIPLRIGARRLHHGHALLVDVLSERQGFRIVTVKSTCQRDAVGIAAAWVQLDAVRLARCTAHETHHVGQMLGRFAHECVQPLAEQVGPRDRDAENVIRLGSRPDLPLISAEQVGTPWMGKCRVMIVLTRIHTHPYFGALGEQAIGETHRIRQQELADQAAAVGQPWVRASAGPV